MFDLYINSDTSSTAGLYAFILFFSVLLAGNVRKGIKDSRSKLFFCLTFLFLWVFYALNNIGADLEPYRGHFSEFVNFTDCRFGEIEIGHQFLMVMLHIFTSNEIVGIILYKTLQISIIFIVAYKLRKDIIFWPFILAYVALVYLQSFNVIRMTLAFSIGVLSLSYFHYGGLKKATLLAIVTIVIHRSSIFFFAGFIVLYLVNNIVNRVSIKKLLVILFIVCILSSFVAVGYIIEVVANGLGGGRYDGYEINQHTNLGLGLIINLAPLFYLLLTSFPARKDFQSEHYRMYLIGLVFSVLSVAIYLLGYQIPIFTRANIYGVAVYLFYLPYYLANYNNKKIVSRKFVSRLAFCIVILIYFFLRFNLQNISLFRDAGIERFEFI